MIEDSLRELIDADYQQRVWVTGSGPEVSSMGEAAAGLFSDSSLDEALEKNTVTFSEEIDAKLRDLQAVLRSSQESQFLRGTADVIASPEWSAVRRKAASILDLLAKRDKGPTPTA